MGDHVNELIDWPEDECEYCDGEGCPECDEGWDDEGEL